MTLETYKEAKDLANDIDCINEIQEIFTMAPDIIIATNEPVSSSTEHHVRIFKQDNIFKTKLKAAIIDATEKVKTELLEELGKL